MITTLLIECRFKFINFNTFHIQRFARSSKKQPTRQAMYGCPTIFVAENKLLLADNILLHLKMMASKNFLFFACNRKFIHE